MISVFGRHISDQENLDNASDHSNPFVKHQHRTLMLLCDIGGCRCQASANLAVESGKLELIAGRSKLLRILRRHSPGSVAHDPQKTHLRVDVACDLVLSLGHQLSSRILLEDSSGSAAAQNQT